MSGTSVLIVGGGMAGLAAAVRLHESGIPVQLLEAADTLGGRVRTDRAEGFLLDRGFQVYLDAYPASGWLLDLPALELGAFEPGALVFREGRLHRLMDVFRRPASLPAALRAPIGSTVDKLRVGLMRMQLIRRSLKAIERAPELSTEAYLRKRGFSPGMIDRFFRSFYGGIFLEHELQTSSRMFEFTFKMFGRGSATLPAAGMGAIPRQLAARLPEGVVRTGTRVTRVGRRSVRLADGREIEGRAVLVAVDAASVGGLLPGFKGAAKRWRSVSNVYFAAERSPLAEPIICLNGDQSGQVNSVCFPSDVSPGYAPGGQTLVSVAVLRDDLQDGSERAIQRELEEWFGPEVCAWRHLRTDSICRALPEQRPGHAAPLVEQHAGVWLCGDYLASASIEGAVRSGEAAATQLQTLYC